ncbi:MAG: DUF72 domain-containing protein [Candidatus Tectimicrobiota bacterium]
MSPESGPVLLGTSGWAHRDWVGVFYPHEMPPSEYFTAYAQHFQTVEIEHTFFDLPLRRTVQTWYQRAPEGFVFSPCLPRRITHEQRLHEVRSLLEDFVGLISDLKDKLGPVLVQLPEDFRHTEQARLEAFLDILPAQVAFAIEFRHGSWARDSTWRLLEQHQVAWVVVDAPFLPRLPQVTASFAYVRWHARPGYQSRRQLDPVAALRPWVPVLQHLARQTQQVYGYVHNQFSGYAPRDCDTLLTLLGQSRLAD